MVVTMNLTELDFILGLLEKFGNNTVKELYNKLKTQKDRTIEQRETMEHRDNVKDDLKNIALNMELIDEDDIISENTLIENFNADSLESVEFIMNVEQQFHFSKADQEWMKLKTVKELVDFVIENEENEVVLS